MENLYNDLRVKEEPKQLPLNIYQSDFDKLKKFVDFMNEGKKQGFGIIAEEDIISKAFSTFDNVNGFDLNKNSFKKRGRPANSENVLPS